jgi:tripartite-type tricarboxylate transporter receptor subunit TctC
MKCEPFFCRVAAALALTVLASAAAAQYPARPVRMLVPNPPGGATDTLGRLFAPKLTERLGQPVVVENRSGSNGNLATESVGKATPDGHTLLLAADAQIVISPHLYAMSVDTLKDLVPVSSLVATALVLVVNASLPVKDLRGFVEYAKRAKPPLAYASIGNGSQHQLAMEMLKSRAGLDMVHVPYKGGGPATLAVLAGDVAAMFGGNSVVTQIKAGKLRAVGLAGRKPAPAYPGVVVLSELYPGLEVTPWLGIFAPAGVAAPVLTRLRGEIGRLLGEADTLDRLRGLGGVIDPFVTTPEEFASFVRSEHAKYGSIVKAIGVKVE